MADLEVNGNELLTQELPLDRYMEEAYRRYAVLTILDRALPDVRDGLKPVQRRILYAMGDMNLTSHTPHKKSARVVGEVLGKYHPHGDQSVYDAMVRMAQDFSMRMPLIDGQGNFGSIDGDGAAAMRYTEARLTALGESMLEDIEKDTVDWRPNFDGSLNEPTVLPARFPNLLVNGVSGIAVGMSTNILPHNLGEVCDAVVHLAKNWARRDKIKVSELMKFIPGPDLPTGGLLYRYRNADGKKIDMIERAYSTGNSTLVCQARADIQDIGGGKSEIIVTELPFQVQKSTILERIATNRDRFGGITDVRDESDYNGMRIVFEVARGADPEEVLDKLLSNTAMRASLSYNALALVVDDDGKASPQNMSLVDLLREFIRHRLKVITRRSQFELARAEARLHVLEGLLKALTNIDEVIDIIRKSQSTETARANLIKKFKLSEIQAQAILDMPLRRLAALERKKLQDEKKELAARVKDLREILKSEERRLALIVDETLETKDRFAEPRRTHIVEAEEGHMARVTVADLVVPTESQLVTVTRNGVQRANAKDYRETTVTRGKPSGRAVDFPLLRITVEPNEVLALITNRGRLWKGNAGRINLQSSFAELGLEPNEQIVGMGIVRPGHKLVLVTRSGNVKRTNVEDLNGRTEGNFATVIGLENDGDQVVLAGIASDEAHVIVVTPGNEKSAPRALRFEAGTVNPQATPNAKGVAAIKTLNEPVIGGAIIEPDAHKGFALAVTEKGHIKRISLDEFTVQGRGGQGLQLWKLTAATGAVCGFTAAASASGDVDIYSASGKRLRLAVKTIPKVTRAAKGVEIKTLIKAQELFAGDMLAGIVPVS